MVYGLKASSCHPLKNKNKIKKKSFKIPIVTWSALHQEMFVDNEFYDLSAYYELYFILPYSSCKAVFLICINGWQLAKMKKSIPDMSLPWNL